MFLNKLKVVGTLWKTEQSGHSAKQLKYFRKNLENFVAHFFNVPKTNRMFRYKLKVSEHSENNSECFPNTEIFCKTYLIVLK